MAGRPLRPATDRRLGELLLHQLANLISATPIARGPFESPAFFLRHYAVLAQLSLRYPPRLGMFRYFTHPFATRHQDLSRAAVRLACVRHAASVQSEPGSNSMVYSSFISFSARHLHFHKFLPCFIMASFTSISLPTLVFRLFLSNLSIAFKRSHLSAACC